MRRLFGITLAVIIGIVVVSQIGSQRDGTTEQEAEPAVVDEPRRPDDIDRLTAIGTTLVNTGAITEYDIAVWSGALDVTISSILPGDAREVANSVCTATRQQFAGQWERAWQLRVFILTSSDRPAAICDL